MQVQELESIHIATQSTPTSAHGSCFRPRLEYDIECQRKRQDEKMNVTTKVVKEEVNMDDEHKDVIEVIS